MNKGEKMKSPTKDDIREQKVTWKNKCKQLEHELAELKNHSKTTKLMVQDMVGIKPFASDGRITASAEKYNLLAEHLNKIKYK